MLIHGHFIEDYVELNYQLDIQRLYDLVVFCT